jgi:RNA polymerase sigma-70 factor (ECF subfamily)
MKLTDASAPDREGGELAVLIGGVAQGDRSALRNLYERTSAKLYGIGLRILRSEADAEEVMQDVFVTVWHRAGSFDRERGSAIAWLSTLARNRAIDRIRRKRLPSTDLTAANDVQDDAPSALDTALGAEQRGRLEACLGQLDERPRRLIQTAFLDGMTYSDLAEQEKVPLGTVKSWIRRSLLRLRECMDR